MFNQFRIRYPNGCLISEFLSVEHGKYLVRSLVQVEGVTLATGLAAAETVEIAEDRARSRALEVLGISTATATAENQIADSSTEKSVRVTSNIQPPAATSRQNSKQPPATAVAPEAPQVITAPLPPSEPISSKDTQADTTPLVFTEPKTSDVYSGAASTAWDSNDIPFGDDEFSPAEIAIPPASDISEFEKPTVKPPKTSVDRHSSEFLKGNEAMPEGPLYPPLTPVPDYPSIEPVENLTETLPADEPIDVDEIIARTNIEMKRLGWTNKQGRDYLERTYGKKMRADLTDPELLEFYRYLESLPTPNE